MGTVWHKRGNWQARYSKLYSSQRLSLPKEETIHRISFMNNLKNPDMSVIRKPLFLNRTDRTSAQCYEAFLPSSVHSIRTIKPVSSSTNYDTALLDMVRARSAQPIKLPAASQAITLSSDSSNNEFDTETCVHGLSYIRTHERSISRSRVSRISTKRDMDIPTILAYTTTTVAPVTITMPEFKVDTQQNESRPLQWSVRRAVCPVCSQKWRDRSSIAIIKNSGLKRSSASDVPSVIAPARLRSAIITQYMPRPAVAAVDEEAGIILGGWRHGTTSWQLTRARKFRVMKPQSIPDVKIPTSEALEKQDLDNRVHRFLSK